MRDRIDPLAAGAVDVWRSRSGDEWCRTYWDSVDAPHRDAVVAAFAPLGAVSSVLELGSGPGANLRRLRRLYPDADLVGIEANDEAARYGSRRAQADGLDIFVHCDTIENAVAGFAGIIAIDVVLACYALCYLSPPRIRYVITKLREMNPRALVVAEPMLTGESEIWEPEPGRYGAFGPEIAEWHHDYRALAGETFSSVREIASVAVEPPADRLRTVLTLEVKA